MNKEVSIVILNYKNWRNTLECLASVLNITYSSYRLIVVDNDSRNNSTEYIRNWFIDHQIHPLCLSQEQFETGYYNNNPAVIIQSNLNGGYAAGNNIGIRWAIRAGSKYVLILNNDTIVQSGFMEPMVAFLENSANAVMAGPKVIDSRGNIDRNCARRRPTVTDYLHRFGVIKVLFPRNKYVLRHYYVDEYDYSYPKEVDVLSGSCMLIKTEILKVIDFLDESTFLFLEEFILCEKLKLINKSSVIIPESVIVHKHGSAISSAPSLNILKSSNESFFYYLKKYRGFSWLLICLIMYHDYFRYCYYKIKFIIKNNKI